VTDDRDWDDDGQGPHGIADGISVGDPVLMKSRLLTEQCSTCIYRPGNLMHLNPGRLKDMTDAARGDEGFVVCHQTLRDGGAPAGVLPAICRGFYDRYSTSALQVIERLWGFILVPPPAPEH
jgi:hypothetical protein